MFEEQMVNGNLVYRHVQGDLASALGTLGNGTFFQATPGDIIPGLISGDLSVEDRYPTSYLLLSNSKGFKISKAKFSSSDLRSFMANFSVSGYLYCGGIKVTENFVDNFNAEFLLPDSLNNELTREQAKYASHLKEVFLSADKREEFIDFTFSHLEMRLKAEAEKRAAEMAKNHQVNVTMRIQPEVETIVKQAKGLALQSRFYDGTPLVRPLVIGSINEKFAIVGDFFTDCGALGYKLR